MKKVKVNFEYKNELLPIMVDESLIHIHNLLEVACDFNSALSKHKPKKADKLLDKDNMWTEAYEYVESKCQEAFEEAFPNEDAFVFGFGIPTKDKDVTPLRVVVIESL